MLRHMVNRAYRLATPSVLLAMSLIILGSRPAHANPTGSYVQSCSAVSITGSTLSASCLNYAGKSDATSLANYSQCRGDIANIDGALACRTPAGEAPSGSYTQSCSSISISGTTLSASCLNLTAARNATSLANYSQCPGDIANFAGNLTCGTADGVRWGAAGHNDRMSLGSNSSYNVISINQQMKLLKSAGLSWYRTACEPADCSLLISAAQANGISLLIVLEPRPDSTKTESENYSIGYQFALSISAPYRGKFQYYEAGDELDVWTGFTGNYDGSQRSQYNQQRYVQARGFIKGMVDGIHAGDPTAQGLVSDTGWCHYGFLQALWQDGVRWDVTAFHWYAAQGNVEHTGCNGANVAAIHASFGVPVWITEYNSDTAAQSDDQAADAAWITQFMTQLRGIASKYRIEGAFAYELLDEPTQQGLEAHLGLFNADGTPKPVVSSMANVIRAQ